MSYGFQTTFTKLYHKRTAHTSSQVGGSSAGDKITVTGSEASYTPNAAASKVVYEISYYAEKDSGPHSVTVTLEHYTSGSWSEVDSSYLRTFLISGAGGQSCRLNMHHRWVIPAWSGERNLRVRVGTRWANMHLTLHKLTEWDGASTSSEFSDTALIIYSA